MPGFYGMLILMPVIYLSLGSNLGNRSANLQAAQQALPPAVNIQAISPVYETAPWGYSDQPAFLNQAVQAETRLDPYALLAHLKDIEARLGRTPTFRYGPRLIDLDILLYDDLAITSPSIAIPHPRLHERAFVLVPLAALAPDLVHPTLHQPIHLLLESVDAASVQPYHPLTE